MATAVENKTGPSTPRGARWSRVPFEKLKLPDQPFDAFFAQTSALADDILIQGKTGRSDRILTHIFHVIPLNESFAQINIPWFLNPDK